MQTDDPAAGPSQPPQPPPPSSSTTAPPEESSRGTLSALWGTTSPTSKTEGKAQPRKRRKKDDAGQAQGRLVLGAEGMSVATPPPPPPVLEPVKEAGEGDKPKRGRGKRKEGGDGESSLGVDRRGSLWKHRVEGQRKVIGCSRCNQRRPPSSWQL